MGYTTEVTSYSNDGGKDIIATLDNRVIFIECKYYGENQSVGRPLVQKLSGAMLEGNATSGILVSTGVFTKHAIRTAEKLNIQTIDKKGLYDLVLEHFPSEDSCLLEIICANCGQASCMPYKPDTEDIACNNCKNDISLLEIRDIKNRIYTELSFAC